MAKIFTTDGFRFDTLQEFDYEIFNKIGKAISHYNLPYILVGCDTRESSSKIKDLLIAGIKSTGIHVEDLNVISTPAISYLSYKYHTLAISITASSKKYNYNGLKLIKNGYKLSKDELAIIETNLNKKPLELKGTVPEIFSIYMYIEKMSKFKIKKELRVVFDISNGSLIYIIEDILKKYEFQYKIINNTPNGKNINDNPEIDKFQKIKLAMQDFNASIGFKFDGDGDQIFMVDEFLNVYDATQVLLLEAIQLKKKKNLRNDAVCLSADTNPGVIETLEQSRIGVHLTKNGDITILNEVNEKDYLLGAEPEGHLINRSHVRNSDGLLNALIVLEYLSESNNKKVQELLNNFKSYPEIRGSIESYNRTMIKTQSFDNALTLLRNELPGKYKALYLRVNSETNFLDVYVSSSDPEINKQVFDCLKEKVEVI